MDISIVDNVHGDGLFVKHFQAHFMNVYSCAVLLRKVPARVPTHMGRNPGRDLTIDREKSARSLSGDSPDFYVLAHGVLVVI